MGDSAPSLSVASTDTSMVRSTSACQRHSVCTSMPMAAATSASFGMRPTVRISVSRTWAISRIFRRTERGT